MKNGSKKVLIEGSIAEEIFSFTANHEGWLNVHWYGRNGENHYSPAIYTKEPPPWKECMEKLFSLLLRTASDGNSGCHTRGNHMAVYSESLRKLVNNSDTTVEDIADFIEQVTGLEFLEIFTAKEFFGSNYIFKDSEEALRIAGS